jgi:hypothetical protein
MLAPIGRQARVADGAADCVSSQTGVFDTCAKFRASPKWQAQLIAILVDALRRLREGETVVDPRIVSRLLGRRRRA